MADEERAAGEFANPSAEDTEAYNKAHTEVLEAVRCRAEKWAVLIASLTSIFGILTPIASPVNFKDLEDTPKNCIVGLLTFALVFVTISFILIFPTNLKVADPLNEVDFAQRLREARDKAAKREFELLKWSICLALLGVLLIAIALGVSLYGDQKVMPTA